MSIIDWFYRHDTLPPKETTAIGIVAGWGELPIWVAKSLHQKGYELKIIALERGTHDPLEDMASVFKRLTVEEGQEILKFLKGNQVKHLVLAGKVPRKKVHQSGFEPDALAQKILSEVGPQKGDERILKAISQALKFNGIQVLALAAVLEEDLTPSEVLTRRSPTDQEWKDIRFGLKMAKTIGKLDIGQMVVVKDGSVLAVEAIEGTDRTIRRVRELNMPGGIIVKASKPQQDLRFDLPVMGEETLILAKEAGCTVVAMEAGKSLIVNRPAVTQKADTLGMTLVGIAS